MFYHTRAALLDSFGRDGHGRALDDLRRLHLFSFGFLVLLEVDVDVAGKRDIRLLVPLRFQILFHHRLPLVVLLVHDLTLKVSLVDLVLNSFNFFL